MEKYIQRMTELLYDEMIPVVEKEGDSFMAEYIITETLKDEMMKMAIVNKYWNEIYLEVCVKINNKRINEGKV